MKRKKAALYDPYLDTVGGGEKHILSILKVLEEHGYDITVFWDSDLSTEFKKKFGISLPSLSFKPDIFKHSGTVKKLQTLSGFDYFFYMTDGSYFFSAARRNVVFAMVPQQSLYTQSLLNKLKLNNYSFIANSGFTQKTLGSWGVRSSVLYPFIDDAFLKVAGSKKTNNILSVGRFFGQLHSKKHLEMIKAFRDLKKQKRYAGFTLTIAGGVKDEDREYFDSVREAAAKDPSIVFKPNISHKELLSLYGKSSYFWHFAGYGVDESIHPEQVEHLGITPLEAMAAGCVTYCYNAGGPKEIITDGINGFLFESADELIRKMDLDEKKKTTVAANGTAYVRRNFSYDVFKKRVEEVLL